jgi:Protein of unknown function (DUF998)
VQPPSRSRAALAGLALSALALAAAPLAMPEGYSWVSQTTSESAAQATPGAWVARLGFVLFGLAVLALLPGSAARWGRVGAVLHAAFGAFMVAAAVFSNRAWQEGVAWSRTEDMLHSIAASAMGIAFAAGVVAVAVVARRIRVLDVVAVAASVLLPLGMTALPAVDGVLQRSMFAVAYAWYATEAARAGRVRMSTRRPRSSGDRATVS